MSNLRIIDNDKTIGDLFNNLAKNEKIPASAQVGDRKEFVMLKFSEEDIEPFLNFRELASVINIGDRLEITFFYKETFINLESRIESINGDNYYISIPSSICTSFKRTKTRYKVKKEDHVYISVYGSNNKYPVIDISTNGLSFEADKELFDQGQSIRNIMLSLGGCHVVYVDAVVKYVNSVGESYYRYGLKFLSIEWMFYQKIFNFIFEKSYPDIRLLKDYSLDDIASLYNESRYIKLKNTGSSRDLMGDILKLEKLKNKTMIAVNLIQQIDGNVEAIASAIRNYNQSFYIQEILSIPNEDMENLKQTDMYVGIADSMLGHPYFKFFIMNVNNDVGWHMEMMRVMKEIINDDDKVGFDGFDVYKCDVETQYETTTVLAYPTENLERFLAYCSEFLTELERETYCYHEKTFWLNELQDIYQSLGYFVARKFYEIKRGDELIAFAVADAFSEEVDIDGHLNSVRLFMVNREFDVVKVTQALLKEVAVFYGKFGNKTFNLITKERIYSKDFEVYESIHKLIMSRDGVVEFLYFLKANII